MRIAVSGTHSIGKTTLIENFIRAHPDYKHEIEPYYQLDLALEPSLESFIEQLDHSINQLNACKSERNIILDRCPIDFIAYSMCVLEQEQIDINDSEVSERFSDVKEALDILDLIVFLPITKKHMIAYNKEDASFRKAVDICFKKIYRDERFDIFPSYGHPKILEISGDRLIKLKKLESCI